MNKPKRLLKDVTFDWEVKDEDDLGAHLAYTLEVQGGAASGYNKPLMLKSEKPEVTPEIIKSLKDLGIETENITKAIFTEDKRMLLSQAIREKDFFSKWDYFWIVDYNEDIVVFCCDEGSFAVGYSMDGVSVTIEDVANPVVPMKDYINVDGEVLISDALKDNLETEMLNMLSKASLVPEVKDFIIKSVTKNSVITENHPESEKDISVKTNKDKGASKVDNLNLQEVLKSDEMQELLKDMIAKATQEKEEKLSKAEAEIADLKKAEEQRVEKNYTDVVKAFSFVEEGQVANLVKGFMESPELAMQVIDVLQKASEEVEKVKAEFSTEIGAEVVDKSKAVKVNDKIAELAAKVRKSK